MTVRDATPAFWTKASLATRFAVVGGLVLAVFMALAAWLLTDRIRQVVVRNTATAAAGGHRVEVVVVDDGSVDGTTQRVADALPRLPGAVVLRNDVPRGLAAARNQGAAVATGVFGADMQVSLVNDGPVTLILDVD